MFAFVLNAGFTQWGMAFGVPHDQFMPPPPPAPPLPSVPSPFEGAAMGWPVATFLHKKAPTVLVDGNPGVQQGHDIGYMIPHVAIPLNALLLLHIGLSKHKVMIPVSSVELEGKPVGTYLIMFLGMVCANPISTPQGMLMVGKCTVQTSATLGDILLGAFYIGFEMAVDALWSKLVGARIKLDPNGPLGSLSGTALGAVLGTVSPLAREVEQIIITNMALGVITGQVKKWIWEPLVVGGVEHGNPTLGRGKAGLKPFGKDRY